MNVQLGKGWRARGKRIEGGNIGRAEEERIGEGGLTV